MFQLIYIVDVSFEYFKHGPSYLRNRVDTLLCRLFPGGIVVENYPELPLIFNFQKCNFHIQSAGVTDQMSV